MSRRVAAHRAASFRALIVRKQIVRKQSGNNTRPYLRNAVLSFRLPFPVGHPAAILRSGAAVPILESRARHVVDEQVAAMMLLTVKCPNAVILPGNVYHVEMRRLFTRLPVRSHEPPA